MKLGQRTFLVLNAYAVKMLKINGTYPSENNRKQNKSSKVEKRNDQREINKIRNTNSKDKSTVSKASLLKSLIKNIC